MLPAAVIFLAALAFNIITKLAMGFAGKLRVGIDSLLFCSVMTGYFYGLKSGMLYGAAIAALFFIINARMAAHAPYVIPLNAAAGALSSFLTGFPLLTAALFVLAFYHAASFAIAFFGYRSAGPGYLAFAALNVVTTYILLGIFAGF